jgi:hypothetical protein
VLFRKEGYSPLFLNASRVKLISGFQTPLQVTTSCRHDHNSIIPFSSVVVTEGHEQLIPFIRSYFRMRLSWSGISARRYPENQAIRFLTVICTMLTLREAGLRYRYLMGKGISSGG